MQGHGWITPLLGGMVARCGGPGMCRGCQQEARDLYLDLERQGNALWMQRKSIYLEKARILALLPDDVQSALTEEAAEHV